MAPELSEGCPGCGFVFPDDEQLVQEEFERNLQFAVKVALSAPDPDDPVSHAGIETEDFYPDTSTIDHYKTNNPLSDLTFDLSYAGGGAQPVEVLAKRSLSMVTLRYRVNGGAVQTAPTAASPDGEVYGGNNAYNRCTTTCGETFRASRLETRSSTGSRAEGPRARTPPSQSSRMPPTPTS